MGKIGDLWVKLGLKKQDFDKGMNDAKKSTESFASKLKNLAPIAKMAWAAVAAAVVKFAADAIKMTQKWGDKWGETMAGVKAAYGAFVRGLASGEGWSQLFDNMREAARLAREAAKALDEVFERKTSFSYQEATTEKQIADLQLIMRDSSKSEKERMAAAQKIIELEKQLGEVKKDIWSQEAAAQRDIFRAQTKMNDDEIDFLVRNYNQNRDIINQSRAYLEQRAKLAKAASMADAAVNMSDNEDRGMAMLQENARKAHEAVAALDAATSQAVKDVAAMTQKYDKTSDELVANMAAAEVAVIRIDTEVTNASMRANSMIGSLKAARGSGTVTTQTNAEEAAEEVKDLSAQLKEAGGNVDLLKRKLVSGADLVAAGWSEAGDAIRAIYTQVVSIGDGAGKEVKMLVTPVLPDGNILTPDLLSEYVSGTLKDAEHALENDALKIVIGVDTEGADLTAMQESVEGLVAQFYESDVALATWNEKIADVIAGMNEAADAAEDLGDVLEEALDPNSLEARLSQMADVMEDFTMKIGNLSEEFGNAVAEGFVDGCQAIADQLVGLEDANPGKVVQALLEPLADMVVKMGEMAIATGVTLAAIKAGMNSMNPYIMIAAGAALVALGVAVKAGLAALASGGASGSVASTYQGGGATNTTQSIETEMTIYVKGQISGNDIVLSGQRTISNYSR